MRLFTFGCSFTNYQWPTWANFVSLGFDKFQNWGQGGAGNYYIANRILECHDLNKITEEDHVLVMFSDYNRYDLLKNDNWNTHGSLYNLHFPDNEQGRNDKVAREWFINNYWTQQHAVYQTWFMVDSVKRILDEIGCKYKFMSAFNLLEYGEVVKTDDDLKESMYANWAVDKLSKILSSDNMRDFKSEEGYEFTIEGGKSFVDNHPTITDHYNWVKEKMSDYYLPKMEDAKNKWESMVVRDSAESSKIFNEDLGRKIIPSIKRWDNHLLV
jgi:hypothetical protein